MKKISNCLCLLVLLFVCGISGAAENKNPFITAKDLDLVHLLPQPPANDSAQTRRELGEVLTLQVTRTPAMEERSIADAVEDIWRFREVLPLSMQAKFNKEALPKLAAFFERVKASEGAVVDPAKDYWKRPRPHQLSDLVKPCVKLSASGAYPSGHATAGYLMATVLAEMIPEKRVEIFDRASEYAENRVIGGIHFRSDIVAGRTAGSLITAALIQKNDYKTEFANAKTELRAQLGL